MLPSVAELPIFIFVFPHSLRLLVSYMHLNIFKHFLWPGVVEDTQGNVITSTEKVSLVRRKPHNKTNLISAMIWNNKMFWEHPLSTPDFEKTTKSYPKESFHQISSEQSFKGWVRMSLIMNDGKKHFIELKEDVWTERENEDSQPLFMCVLTMYFTQRLMCLSPDFVMRSLHSHLFFNCTI